MGNIASAAATGATGTATMVVGQGGVDIDIIPVVATKPSYLSVDLLSGAYSHAFTIGDLMTVIGFSLTMLAVYVAVKRDRIHNRRDSDK